LFSDSNFLLGVPAVALLAFINIRNSKFCDSCGRQNYGPPAKFCSKCGAPLK
jgi:ribosomal protein L37E